MQYIEGETLADVLEQTKLDRETAGAILHDILFNIWIPVWAFGLRFKDCHPGNFVLTNSSSTVTIDTEQMRKDAQELLSNGAVWNQRDKHEASGLKRLPGLIQRIVSAAHLEVPKTHLLREIKTLLADVNLIARFRQLGRTLEAREQAVICAQDLMDELGRRD